MTNIRTSSMPVWKQLQNAYQPNIVPYETLAIREKQDDMKTASICNKRNPANANIQKLNKAQKEQIS